MEKVLLDTDVFSEITKAKNPAITRKATQYFQEHKRYTLSVITVMEIIEGWHKKQQPQRIEQFQTIFQTQEVLSFSYSASVLAGKIYADLEGTGQRIGYPDCMIAAIAIVNNLPLVTGHLNHYQRIQNLNYSLILKNWAN